MKKSRYLRIYDLHSWSGIVLGLFVYVVSFTGCVALFDNELRTWEDPAKRLEIADEIVPIMPIVESWIDQNAQDETVLQVSLFYPYQYEPYFKVFMATEAEDGERTQHRVRWDTEHGKELTTKTRALTEWLLDFHRDLMWPATLGGRTAGRSLVGVAGIILMISIITGIITHTKIIREFFTLRVKRSVHLKWQDLHKVLGLWALPFYTMIAFTGAILGVIAIMAPIAAALAFKGDTEALILAVQDVSLERSGVQAKMLSFDELKEMRHPQSNEAPTRINVLNWGDEVATYTVRFDATSKLKRTNSITLNGVTGEVINTEESVAYSSASRVNSTISPLHYGTYGGIWLKILYFVLGVFLCVVTATGMMVWIERRLKSNKGQLKPEFYLKLGRLSTGVIMGFPVASIAIFYLDKLYLGEESARLFYTGLCYFAAVFLSVAFAMYKKNIYHTTRVLFLLVSVGLLGLPIVNALVTKSVIWQGLAANQSWAWVDFAFIGFGLALLLISLYLPKGRSSDPRKKGKAIHNRTMVYQANTEA